MKLRNKKTGEVIETQEIYENVIGKIRIRKKAEEVGSYEYEYNSLAEFNEEWEDYEEPKENFVITCDGKIITTAEEFTTIDECEGIGNYFETAEEAERAVEKLKAWKRLKDNGFTINRWLHTPDMSLTTGSRINIKGFIPEVMKNLEDLDLLFGGEE